MPEARSPSSFAEDFPARRGRGAGGRKAAIKGDISTSGARLNTPWLKPVRSPAWIMPMPADPDGSPAAAPDIEPAGFVKLRLKACIG